MRAWSTTRTYDTILHLRTSSRYKDRKRKALDHVLNFERTSISVCPPPPPRRRRRRHSRYRMHACCS